jgi:energy-coupling factor transport system ATP-binding protein
MDPIIRISHITHYYSAADDSKIAALNDVTLEIKPGEFVAVIGHNGSGKSTLAKHMNALLLPDEGSVWVNGMDTNDQSRLWEIRRSAGMVFQNPDNQLVATMVEEDVAFGPENLGLPVQEIRKRVDEALAMVGMTDYREQAPHTLSGGQKQRVAIAGVLAMRPSCVILDEPTAMLDPVGRSEVLETVRKLNREEGMTVILITHFMDEAVNADRVVVMDEGRIVMDAPPKEVFSQVDELRRLHLDIPQVTELAHQLQNAGLEIPPNILTVEEMADALCR